MLDLNFLPDNEQKFINRSLVMLLARNILAWLVLITLISILMLIWSKYFLEYSLTQEREQSILVNISKLSFADEIDKVNQELDDVEKIQSDYVAWSGIMAEFSEIIPPHNRVESLSLDAVNQKFFMKGFSQTRDDLLALEKQLDNSSLFYDIDSPLSNLLKSENIQFEFSGKINLNMAEKEDETL